MKKPKGQPKNGEATMPTVRRYQVLNAPMNVIVDSADNFADAVLKCRNYGVQNPYTPVVVYDGVQKKVAYDRPAILAAVDRIIEGVKAGNFDAGDGGEASATSTPEPSGKSSTLGFLAGVWVTCGGMSLRIAFRWGNWKKKLK